MLGSGLKGAHAPGERLKGSYNNPIGRRPGNPSGFSQIGKYIAQGNNLNSLDAGYNFRDDAQNNSFMPYDRNQIGNVIVIITHPDPYQGMNNPGVNPVTNLSQQFNQFPQGNAYYPNFSNQNDIFEKLMQELNSSKTKPKYQDDLESRLEKLEINNMKLKKQLQKQAEEKKSNSNAMQPQPPMPNSMMPFNNMGNFPFNQYPRSDNQNDKELTKEDKKLKKEQK